MRKFHVKPAEGLKLRHPTTGKLHDNTDGSAEPFDVPASPYWRRRLKHGDVVEVSPAKPKKTKPKAAATAAED